LPALAAFHDPASQRPRDQCLIGHLAIHLDALRQIRHDFAGAAADVQDALAGLRPNVAIDEISRNFPAPTAVCKAL
jgi:hypothetical protein